MVFYTLDGYFANYPLYYKHKFYNVIENELERDPYFKSYFLDWGSKCYAFSTEIGIEFDKKIGKIQLLDLTMNIFNQWVVNTFFHPFK